MGKKFYFVIFCILSCSVLLLGLSYSKKSDDSFSTDFIEYNYDDFRVIYSHDNLLNTNDNNKLRVTLINKKQVSTGYALYLREENNKDISGVYYTINGEDYVINVFVFFLGNFHGCGYYGVSYIFDISVSGIEDYSFYYSVGEVSYGS